MKCVELSITPGGVSYFRKGEMSESSGIGPRSYPLGAQQEVLTKLELRYIFHSDCLQTTSTIASDVKQVICMAIPVHVYHKTQVFCCHNFESAS